MRATRESIQLPTPGEQVPGILLRPSTDSRAPGVLLLHGLSSTKERMAASIGVALAGRGLASLAIALPLHGTREGDVRALSPLEPFAIISKWRLAVTDA